ncbi:hypothetical protein LCGC14_2810240, partial [marine sediment metagenome]
MSLKSRALKMMTIAVLAMGVLLPASAVNADILDSLEGYWQFEQADPYADSSVNNNDLEAVASTTGPTFGPGQVGDAVILSGAPGGWEYLRTIDPITSAVTGSNPRTMNTWFRADADQFSVPVSYGTTAVVGQLFEVLLLDSGHAFGGVYGGHFWGGNNDTYVAPPANPVYGIGEWNMATVVYGGGTTMDFYVNGQLLKTSTVYSIDTTTVVGDDDLEAFLVGATNWPVAGWRPPTFTGAVDDVALWSRTLDAGEVQAVFNAGVNGGDLYSISEA